MVSGRSHFLISDHRLKTFINFSILYKEHFNILYLISNKMGELFKSTLE